MNHSDRECTEDWVVRSRRNLLSELEEQALAVHLSQCPSCRAVSALSTLFDTIPEKQPGDEQLIAQVAERAFRPASHGTRGWRWLAVAAGLVVLVGVAAAAFWGALEHGRQPRPLEAPASPRAARPVGASVPRPGESAPQSGISAAAPEAAGAAPAPSGGATMRASGSHGPGSGVHATRPGASTRPRSQAVAGAGPMEDPAPLFAEANATRRAGELRHAVALYQALRRRFPDSNEAALSALSEGDLLLALAEPARALAAFDAYLGSHPAGALTEEALFGRARCLGKLGRSAEERQAWEELMRRFPNAASRPVANKRLQDLAP